MLNKKHYQMRGDRNAITGVVADLPGHCYLSIVTRSGFNSFKGPKAEIQRLLQETIQETTPILNRVPIQNFSETTQYSALLVISEYPQEN
ncbi:hypothetical protein CEXT_626721 [Caerostris extrusa]|uniref:Uncharacterized protein n=1 Tax=Caerostris extrusa TaxID=172846 RepID=A0AAV4RJA7_CAEEX|nr:hypothetical protein CEXT_626721 [Caerostris extrusa]